MTTETRAMVPAGNSGADILERVITAGDLSRLQPAERVQYYRAVAESIGINPLTKPFDYLTLNGKLVLYVNKGATDQLRSIRGISIDGAERDATDPDYATWLVTGHDTTGRVDTEIGSVPIKGLQGEARANAVMKALTKGKRRLTLSLAGLGWLDESEVGSIPNAAPVDVDPETGEVRQAQRPRTVPEQIAERKASLTTSTTAAVDAVPVVVQADSSAAAPTPAPEVAVMAEGAGGSGVIEGTAVKVADRCAAFHADLGRCQREEGHPEPGKGRLFHIGDGGQTWKDAA